MSDALKTIRKHLSNKEIEKMDFKELRSEVQNLRDTLSQALRVYEDIIYNLDNDNFSTTLIKEKDNMKSEIKVTAEEISTSVARITELDDRVDKAETSIKQTADDITAQAERIDGQGELISLLQMSAGNIQTMVQRTLDLTNAVPVDYLYEMNNTDCVYLYKEHNPENYNEIISETYYIFDNFYGEWRPLSSNELYTTFTQTDDMFYLRGNVRINGDLITEGTISADRIDVDNLKIHKLYSVEGTNDMYAKVNSTYGEFGAYKIVNNSEQRIWSITPADQGAISFYQKDHLFLDVGGRTATAWGDWDFSFASVDGLTATAVFG